MKWRYLFIGLGVVAAIVLFVFLAPVSSSWKNQHEDFANYDGTNLGELVHGIYESNESLSVEDF